MEACGSHRNRDNGKQETWISCLLNPEDQRVLYAVEMVFLQSRSKDKKKILNVGCRATRMGLEKYWLGYPDIDTTFQVTKNLHDLVQITPYSPLLFISFIFFLLKKFLSLIDFIIIIIIMPTNEGHFMPRGQGIAFVLHLCLHFQCICFLKVFLIHGPKLG